MKLLQQTLILSKLYNLGRANQSFDVCLYELITGVKLFGLRWHLGFDVGSSEDILEIHPFPLGLDPLLNNLHDELNF